MSLPVLDVAPLAALPLADVPPAAAPRAGEEAAGGLPQRLPHVRRGEAVHGKVLAVVQDGDESEGGPCRVRPGVELVRVGHVQQIGQVSCMGQVIFSTLLGLEFCGFTQPGMVKNTWLRAVATDMMVIV